MVVIDDRNGNFVNWFMVYLFVFFLKFYDSIKYLEIFGE